MNPYQSLDQKHFWSTAVAQKNMFDISDLWNPKFRIGQKMKVATYGSCFAQHIGRALAKRDFTWMISERAPSALSDENAKKYNYGIFTARTGNIYTVSLLNQWLDWALHEKQVPKEIWEKDGRFFDPFRPNIEPDGFTSEEEMHVSRTEAIKAFRKSVVDCDVFVFTLGLTESWTNSAHGYEYPLCPGTVAGDFNKSLHKFSNQGFNFIRSGLAAAISKMKSANPNIKIILTVSPVPLTATMSGNHVLPATVESKSILRAVAGSIARGSATVDYFPSFEIISSTPYRGAFFEPNQRNVNHTGVDHVMNCFFSCLENKFPAKKIVPKSSSLVKPDSPKNKQISKMISGKNATHDKKGKSPGAPSHDDYDLVCEEEILNAFSHKIPE